MFRKIERRFIIINMCCVGSILLILLLVVVVSSYHKRVNKLNRMLNMKMDIEKDDINSKQVWIGKGTLQDDFIEKSGVLRLIVDENGKILQKDDRYAKLSKETDLSVAVQKILESDKENGIIDDMELFYVKQDEKYDNEDGNNNDGIRIALTSRDYIVAIDESVKACAFFSLLVMVIIFVVSIFWGRASTAPAKEAWKAKKQFIADASHELKTPISVILANHHIIMQNKKETVESQEKWITSIYDETVHMKKLVEELLFLAKLDANEKELEYTKQDISEVILGAVLQFEPVAFEKNVSIEYNILPDVYVLGDATNIKQLVHILLDNAVKYSKNGGSIYVDVKKIQSKVLFLVSNTGEYLDDEVKKHVFERFYRSDQARTTGGGYGLGLSIAKGIVDNLNGEISVKNDSDRGVVFEIKIPLYNKSNNMTKNNSGSDNKRKCLFKKCLRDRNE